MDARVNDRVLEAEISVCCRAIYQASDAESALQHWRKLHELKQQWTEEENRLFLLESRGASLRP